MRWIEPGFPLSHGVPRVDDRRIASGIIFVFRNNLRRRDAPPAYGPHKTINNRFSRRSRLDMFNRIFGQLAAKDGKPDRAMIDDFPAAKALLTGRSDDAGCFVLALAERGIAARIPSKTNRKLPIRHDTTTARRPHIFVSHRNRRNRRVLAGAISPEPGSQFVK